MGQHIIQHVSIAEGIRRIWQAGLMVNDETTSRVLLMTDSERGQGQGGIHDDGCDVLATWLAVDPVTHEDVGMAMVSSPTSDSDGRPVLNLYVRHDHQQRGLGRRLAEAAKAAFPDVCGYYTLDAVRLYASRNLPPAELVWTPEVETAWKGGDKAAAQALHIQAVMRGRHDFDRVFERTSRRCRP